MLRKKCSTVLHGSKDPIVEVGKPRFEISRIRKLLRNFRLARLDESQVFEQLRIHTDTHKMERTNADIHKFDWLLALFFLLGCYSTSIKGETVSTTAQSSNSSTTFINPWRRNLITNYSLLCPFYAECSRPSMLPPDLLFTCCDHCSCNEFCHVTENCCPDIIEEYTIHWEIIRDFDSKYECTVPRLKQTNDIGLYDSPYMMISKCSDRYDDSDIRKKCENPYANDVISDGYLAGPVESSVANALFRNKYCALCNFIADNITAMWDPWILCEDSYNGEITPKNVLDFIMSNDYCNIIFRPSANSDMDHEICDDKLEILAVCNISGSWEAYDPYVDAACHAFTSYFRVEYLIYRNAFCYICNIDGSFLGEYWCAEEVPFADEVWKSGSFSALLDFNQGHHSTPTNDLPHDICGDKFVFDTHKEECRELHCSPPRVFTATGCDLIYRQVAGTNIEVYVKMPISVPTSTINPFVSRLLAERVEALVGELNLDKICTMTIYAGVESENDRVAIEDIKHERRYEYILVHIFAALQEIHDLDALLTDIVTFQYEHMSSMMEGYFSDTYLDSIVPDSEEMDVLHYVNNTMGPWGPEPECIKRPIKVTLQSNCIQVRLNKEEIRYNDIQGACTNSKLGEWCFPSKKYTVLENGSIAMCLEDYLSTKEVETRKDNTENWVSLICTSVSVLCLVITLVTYCIFKDLRTIPGKINMALVISMIFAQLFFQFGLNGSTNEIICAVLGVCIHFLWLLTMFWMSACCIHMLRMFVSIKKQLSVPTSHLRILLTYSAYCITMSALFVLTNITYSLLSSGKQVWGYGGPVCYISTSKMIGFTFALPVGFVVISNIVMFFVVIWSIHGMPEVQKNAKNERNNLVIYIKLSTVTGAAWIFGFVYQWTGSTALVYIFIVLNCCQGIFIMLSFICNRRVMKLYSKLFQRRHVDDQSTTRDTSMTFTNLSGSAPHHVMMEKL
ncbi:hypothetical protein ScPMuIL_013766 [Solemya velum]